jgi:hypothetical protein
MKFTNREKYTSLIILQSIIFKIITNYSFNEILFKNICTNIFFTFGLKIYLLSKKKENFYIINSKIDNYIPAIPETFWIYTILHYIVFHYLALVVPIKDLPKYYYF